MAHGLRLGLNAGGLGHSTSPLKNPVPDLGNLLSYVRFNEGHIQFDGVSQDVNSVVPITGNFGFENVAGVPFIYDPMLFSGEGGIKATATNANLRSGSGSGLPQSTTIGFMCRSVTSHGNNDVFSFGNANTGFSTQRIVKTGGSAGRMFYTRNEANSTQTFVDGDIEGKFYILLNYRSASELDIYAIDPKGIVNKDHPDPADIITKTTIDPGDNFQSLEYLWLGSRNGTGTSFDDLGFYDFFMSDGALDQMVIDDILAFYRHKIITPVSYLSDHLPHDYMPGDDAKPYLSDFFELSQTTHAGFIPSGTYTTSPIDQELRGSVRIYGEGEGSVLKLMDNIITVPDESQIMINLDGYGGTSLIIEDFTLDMNYQNQVAPVIEAEPGRPTSLQQSHSLSLKAGEPRGYRFVLAKNITIRNPIGDGIGIRGITASQGSHGQLICENIIESEIRPYTRSSYTITCNFDHCVVRDCLDIESFEIEIDHHQAGFGHVLDVENCYFKRSFDVFFKNPIDVGQVTMSNITVDGRFNARDCDLTVDGFEIIQRLKWHYITGDVSARLSPRNYVFKNGSFRNTAGTQPIAQGDDDSAIGGLVQPTTSVGYTALFENVDFHNDDPNSLYIFIDNNQQQSNDQFAIFRHCNFYGGRIRCQSIRLTLDHCTADWDLNTANPGQEAFILGLRRSGVVDTILTFSDLNIPNSYIYRPSTAPENNAPYTINANNVTTNHGIIQET